uniref:Homeobox domain-containing protein n=1 Tax=Rhabditophanes sp. KR3021 TaxID=114890 RepID=A0AC35UAS8_9BILA
MSNFSIEQILSARLPSPFQFPPAVAAQFQFPGALSAAVAANLPNINNNANSFLTPTALDLLAASNPFAAWMQPTSSQYPFFGFSGHPYMMLSSNGNMHQSMSSKRKRRHRTIFTDDQLSILEETFLNTQYPDISMREKLAVQCSLKDERVEVWFKNRRAKHRKQKKGPSSCSGRDSKDAKISGSDDSDIELSDTESGNHTPPKVKKIENEKSPVNENEINGKKGDYNNHSKDGNIQKEMKDSCPKNKTKTDIIV